jgi:hypothetical protein
MRTFLLIVHLLGVTLVAGMAFAQFILGMARSKMNKEDAVKDIQRIQGLGMMGDLGLTFILISGFLLMKPFWPVLFTSHYLLGKLTLVTVLITLLVFARVYSQKIQKTNEIRYLARIRNLGLAALPLVITIIILAVLMFR